MAGETAEGQRRRPWKAVSNRLPVVLQSESGECGLACISMLCNYYGREVTLRELRSRYPIGSSGTSLKRVISVVSSLGFAARPLRIELDELSKLQVPCVLHWDMSHYVVLRAATAKASGALKSIVIHDPARGVVALSREEASPRFTGIALEMSPTETFQERAVEAPRLRLRSMIEAAPGFKRAFVHVLGLATALEILALISPLFMQWVVDGALIAADRDLLGVLAISFAMLVVLQCVIGLFRSRVVLYVSTRINVRWTMNVFTHLVRLPLDFFQKRHLGDITSRFGSVENIQRVLSVGLVEAALDGAMAIATFVMLIVYSPKLTAVVCVTMLLYGLIRYVSYHPLRNASAEQLNLQAREQTLLLESIRSIQTVKLFGKEDERRDKGSSAMIDASIRGAETQRMALNLSGAHHLLSGLENVLVIWLAAGLVIDNALSVGMMYAFLAYKNTFSARAYALIDKGMEFRMLSVQTERLSDIVLSKTESAYESDQPLRVDAMGPRDDEHAASVPAIEMRNVSFRYSDFDPWIIEDISLTIHPCESVAIVGPSGCGKTTLIKIMLGLLEPSKGEILVDGVSMSKFGIRAYRRLFGSVMQEDQLLSGTIEENITFFDPEPDDQRLYSAAAMAAIADDIDAMPMKYFSLIGDMGSILSGGQKQRLLLARAIYRNPKILVLDEATSHLDTPNERRVNAAINELNVSRVIVAHRLETVQSASRVIDMSSLVRRALPLAPES